MITLTFLLAFVVPCALTMLLVPLVREHARRRGWVDKPDGKRKLHTRVTPNVGGLAMVVGGIVSLLVLFATSTALPLTFNTSTFLVVLGGLFIVGVGMYDDIHELGVKQKFVVQLLAAYLLLHAGYRFDVEHLPFVPTDLYGQSLFVIPLTVLWVVGILNAINLLDGLDGLAAGVSLIAFAGLFVIFVFQGNVAFAVVALVMVGVTAAFLVYNSNPASIFMGDCGSLFLGYMVALCTLSVGSDVHDHAVVAFLIPVLVVGLPILDTTVVFVRRIQAGGSPFSPDRGHLHHRLADLYSRKKAVWILYGVACWFSIAAILVHLAGWGFAFAIIALTSLTVVLALRLLTFAERRDAIYAIHSSDHVKQDGNEVVEPESIKRATEGASVVDYNKLGGREEGHLTTTS